MLFHLYTDALNGELQDFELPKQTDSYRPSPELQTAVNVALSLGQPLLLTGEPGTGKTRLAWHLASYFKLGELDVDKPNQYKPLVFNAQTTSIKKDLFYTYDALGHFQWVHNSQEQPIQPKTVKDFIRCEALGKAIIRSLEEGKRSVVLIDEIDKAPRDLPNDLLAALEDLEFTVPEIPGNTTSYKCPPNLRPIIIITSNSEKDLPDAFLRRVIYHHIEFKEDKLLEILLDKKIEGLLEGHLKLIIEHFKEARTVLEKGSGKKPATAELISWATLLTQIGLPIEKLEKGATLSNDERDLLNGSYAVLAKTREDLQSIRK